MTDLSASVMTHAFPTERKALRADPEREAKAWLDKLADVGRKRSAYQDQQAEGLITIDELRAKLAALGETRETAERELAALEARREQLAALERDRDALMEYYAGMVPEALDDLMPAERHHVYKLLKLRADGHLDGTLEVSGVFGERLVVCETKTLCRIQCSIIIR